MISTRWTRKRFAGLIGLLLLAMALPATAQTVQGEPTDLKFTVVNATTGQPGTVDRMTIEYVRSRRNGILDFEPSGSEFVAPGVPIKDVGEYIVAVWFEKVPYWWSMRGRDLIGQTTTLHVFDTTTRLDGVSIKGMNVIIRRQDSLLNLEYMLQVENAASPQQTIFDRVATFELDFPAGAREVEASYRRGPDPTPIPADTHGSQRLSLAVPLTPGVTQIQVTAVVPWQEGMTVPVGSNLAVASWSVLASPEWLEVRAMELERAESGAPGFKRLTGPALSAGRDLALQLFSGEHEAAPEADLFATDSTATAAAGEAGRPEAAAKGGFPLPLVFTGFVIIIVAALAIRRRRQ